nr:hexokinase [Haematococcus lacustris]
MEAPCPPDPVVPVGPAAAAQCSAASTAGSGFLGAGGQNHHCGAHKSGRIRPCSTPLPSQLGDGLQRDITADGRHMLMLPSFVLKLPDGTETGDAYAIDLGGTNFRVMHVRLSEQRSLVAAQELHEVALPVEVYTGSCTQLFDFLAHTLTGFIREHGGCNSMKAGGLPVVGFCFSFPTHQTALDAGVLLDWTKNFTCVGAIGQDPVKLLSEALERAGQPCHIAALLNDSVAVLAAHRYLEPSTSIAVIIGTGTNACYVERLGALTKWRPTSPSGQLLDLAPETETVVNVEWGSFWSPALPHCAEDWEVDAATAHQGKGMFEKLLSGMFLGEVARRMLLRLVADTKLLGDWSSSPDAARVMATLAVKGVLTTAHLAAIVEDRSPRLTITAQVLSEALGAGQKLAPWSSRRVVRCVCEMVARRSALMLALGLRALLIHTGWVAANRATGEEASQTTATSRSTDRCATGYTTVAFDGGVYAKFGAYRDMLRAALDHLLGPELSSKVHFELSHDGSCFGAAVLAVAATKPWPRRSTKEDSGLNLAPTYHHSRRLTAPDPMHTCSELSPQGPVSTQP